MKELPRKLKGFVVAHGPQSLIVLVGAVALVVSGMFLLGNPVFGLSTVPTGENSTQAEVQTSDSVASIKDKDGDADGLSDLEERLYHTDPTKADTDGDGYKDGEEVEQGYDPASKFSAGIEATGGDLNSNGSLLSLLDGASQEQNTDSAALGLGGLGGEDSLTQEQIGQLGDAVLPDGQKLADLEVDQILNTGSRPLPDIDENDIKTSSETSPEAEQAHAKLVAGIVVANNPFPKGYSVKSYLDDVGAGNRALLENMKFSAETMLQQIQELKVPKSMLEEHTHALGILRASRDQLQEVLTANVSSDSILSLLGRSFFMIGEIRALLEDTQLELSS